MIWKNKKLALKVMILFLSTIFFHSNVMAGNNQNKKTKVPLGYIENIVFLSDGVYQSPDGSALKDGVAEGDGMDFQKNIMGRSDIEIEQQIQKTAAFFEERFGVFIDNELDILFTGYEIDPLNKLRVIKYSGEKVPKRGWTVHDGGFQAIVVNPDGITLGGEFEGVHVPVNTVLVHGEYKLMREKQDPLVIRYRSLEPLILGQFGSVIRCEVDSDDYGIGFTGGILGNVQGENGFIHSNIKTVITFPPLGPNNHPNRF